MIQSWNDQSEIVAGLLIEKRISPNRVLADELPRPYDELARAIKKNPAIDKSELIEKFGLSVVRTATDAAASLNGLGDSVDWVDLLHNSFVQYEVGTGLESVAKKLQRGMEIDIPKTVELVSRLTNNHGSFLRMSDVEAGDMRLIRTGVHSVDYHIGGIPEAGLVTIAAPPKTGKTSFMAAMIASYTEKHKNKTAIVFTREMLESQYKKRTMEVYPELSQEAQSRIVLCHDVSSVGEVASKAATVGEDLGIIGVDFADLLIGGMVDPAKMEEVYRVLALLANQLRVPVVLLAQLSGGYRGGIPRPHHLRWTRMAEALSWTLWTLYAPARDYFAEEKEKDKLLPVVPGKSYLAAWFCRSATKIELPGAIQLNWNGATGWSKNRGRWFSLEKNTKVNSDEIEDDETWSKAYEDD